MSGLGVGVAEQHLSLGAVVKAAPLTYVEAWSEPEPYIYTIRKIYFEWEGMEAMIAKAISGEVKALRFSVPDGVGGVSVTGVWRA